jgi:hypothetical protein
MRRTIIALCIAAVSTILGCGPSQPPPTVPTSPATASSPPPAATVALPPSPVPSPSAPLSPSPLVVPAAPTSMLSPSPVPTVAPEVPPSPSPDAMPVSSPSPVAAAPEGAADRIVRGRLVNSVRQHSFAGWMVSLFERIDGRLQATSVAKVELDEPGGFELGPIKSGTYELSIVSPRFRTPAADPCGRGSGPLSVTATTDTGERFRLLAPDLKLNLVEQSTVDVEIDIACT